MGKFLFIFFIELENRAVILKFFIRFPQKLVNCANKIRVSVALILCNVVIICERLQKKITKNYVLETVSNLKK